MLKALHVSLRPWRRALGEQRRVLAALIYRELKTRFGQTRVGFFSAFIEPIIHILVIFSIWGVLGRFAGGSAIDPLIFIATGLFPFFMFRDTVMKITKCVSANKALLTFPQIKILDFALARALLELMTYSVVFFIFLIAADFVGYRVEVFDINRVFGGMFLIWLTGCGAGLALMPFTGMFQFVDTLIGVAMRFLYFTSGVLFAIDRLPKEIRDYLSYNPIIHIVEYIRSGFFRGYAENSAFPDMPYAISICVFLLITGLAFKKSLLRLIME